MIGVKLWIEMIAGMPLWRRSRAIARETTRC
jgi:hypothetical protein